MSYSAAKNSKYRHIFADPKKETFQLRNVLAPGAENGGVAGNSKWWATSTGGGGGKLAVLPHSAFGARMVEFPSITGHTGKILDFAFSPYDEDQVATVSEDMSVKVWQIPEDGIKDTLSDAVVEMTGHQKKINVVVYHPVADNLLLTAAHDSTLRLWDVVAGQQAVEYNAGGDLITYSVSFNLSGKQFATTNKDKKLRIFDTRSGAEAICADGHEGVKPQLATWMTKSDKIVTFGFSKQSVRQVFMWDPRNMSAVSSQFDIDTGAGVYMPMYDPDADLMFFAAKGDSTIFWAEIQESGEFVRVGDSKPAGPPLKSVGLLPKSAVDVTKHEIDRIVRIRGDEAAEVLSMIVPRKAKDFQEDIFPDTFSSAPGCSGGEWLAGQDAERSFRSMKPGAEEGVVAPKRTLKSAAMYEAELKQKDKKIAELEAKVKELTKKLGA